MSCLHSETRTDLFLRCSNTGIISNTVGYLFPTSLAWLADANWCCGHHHYHHHHHSCWLQCLAWLACALARHIVCVIGLEAVALEDDESWPSKKPGKKERKEAVTVLSLGSWHLKNGRSQQHSTPTLDLRQTHGIGSVGDGQWCR